MELDEQQIRDGFQAVIGMPAREADVQAVQLLGATSESMADYIWDHWLGEPDGPISPGKLQSDIEEAVA